jgi:DNA-directed RNA polymerase specialized sigma24 family protein
MERMGKPKPTLKDDVQGLLKESVVEEAVEASWKKFETALSGLQPESGEILSSFLGGRSPERIASDLGTTAEEVRALLDRAKRDLRNQLRAATKMKH